MKKEELQKLLETPLDPDLDYFDATASIEAMAEHIRGLQNLIQFMFETMALQGQSIIDIRKEMVEVKGDLLLHEVPRSEPEPLIIMPDKKRELN